MFPYCLRLKGYNYLSLIYSFRAVVLNLGDFAYKGHLMMFVDIFIVTMRKEYFWHLMDRDQHGA